MADPTLKQASEAYLKHLESLGKKPATVFTYGKDLEVIRGYFGDETKLSGLQPAKVGKWLKSDSLLKSPEGKARAERTVAKTVRVFRMMLVWCEETKRVKKLPLPGDFPMGYSRKEAKEAEGAGDGASARA